MDQSSSIEDPTPEAFEELLQDDDTSESDADSLDEQVVIEVDDEHQLLEPEIEILSEQEDGSLLPLDTRAFRVLGQDVKPDPEDGLDFNGARLSSESDENDDDRQGRANSPLSSPGLSTPLLLGLSPGLVLPRRGRGAAGQGRGAAGRGRGRGRGRSALQPRRGSLWSRGQPMLEMYPRDEDLPAFLADECRRLKKSRDVRESVARGKRNPAVDEDEEDFRDCEGFSWAPMDEWQGEKEVYEPRRPPGPSKPFLTGYDALRAYWDDGILSHIVTETNNYAEGIQSASFKRNWIPTNLDEIWCLIAFWMMLGIVKMPSIRSCFSSMRILRTEVFGMLFTETRYWALNRAFHLAKGSRADNDPTNPLYAMGPVLDHLVTRFQELYEPEQNVCIDESLILWKGPLSFSNYIKTKAARYGIKTCELCESATGYMCSFFVCVGRKSVDFSPLPCSSATVLKLFRHRLNLGHVLYMDNWFNSPLLARYLKRRRTDCVGTLRASRKDVPAVIQRAALNEGEFIARQSGDVTVVALMDSKRVHLLSTFHDTAQIQTENKSGRPAQYKMKLVSDYNANMGGVDMLDQMLEAYLVERKQCKKWTRKLFKRLLNVSIQNARILVEKSTGTRIDSLGFRLALVQAIMTKHLSNTAQRRTRHSVTHVPTEARLTERHFPAKIQVTDEMRAKIKYKTNRGRGLCVWCKSINRATKTTWECPDCKVPLCCEKPCFRLYHTLPEPLPKHYQ